MKYAYTVQSPEGAESQNIEVLDSIEYCDVLLDGDSETRYRLYITNKAGHWCLVRLDYGLGE